MELTQEEYAVMYDVLTEKRDTLEVNAQRAIKRIMTYKQMPDCINLANKARGTVDKNLKQIGVLDRILKKIKIA